RSLRTDDAFLEELIAISNASVSSTPRAGGNYGQAKQT
ncbi:hypothetical protein L195_g052273, partial [Trifolium pratense]